MTTVMRSMEPETVLGNGASPDEIARYVTGHAESGSIILLHPMYKNPVKVPAAPDIHVPELREQGYEFYTVSALYDAYRRCRAEVKAIGCLPPECLRQEPC